MILLNPNMLFLLRHRLLLILLLPGMLMLSLSSCSNQKSAGGTTVETTNGFAGVVMADTGDGLQPVSGAQIIVTAAQRLGGSASYTTTTDTDGRWQLEDLPEMDYTIISRSNTRATILQSIRPDEESISLELEKTATLTLDISAMPLKPGDTLGLAGTDVFVVLQQADIERVTIQLQELPPGVYTNWIIAGSENSQNFLLDTLEAEPEAQLESKPLWPYRGTIELQSAEIPDTLSTVYGLALKIKLQAEELGDWNQNGLFCVLEGSDADMSAPRAAYYTSWADSSGVELWIQTDSISPDNARDWTLFWNTENCSTDEDAVFPGASNTHWHLQEKEFSGSNFEELGLMSDLDFLPDSLLITVTAKPDQGQEEAELISMGNSVGIRLASRNDSLFTYSYSAFSGPNEWNILSSGEETDSGWKIFHLLADPARNRLEIYTNGQLISAAWDTVNPIDYSREGNNIIVGRHALEEKNFLKGLVDEVQIYNSPKSAEWIFLQSLNLIPENNQLLVFTPEP